MEFLSKSTAYIHFSPNFGTQISPLLSSHFGMWKFTCNPWEKQFGRKLQSPPYHPQRAKVLLGSNVNRKESFVFLKPRGLFPLMINGTVMCILQNRTLYHCTVPAPVTYLVKYAMFWPWVAIRDSPTVGLLFCFYINLVPLHVLMDWVRWPWFPRILLAKTRTTLMWRLT